MFIASYSLFINFCRANHQGAVQTRRSSFCHIYLLVPGISIQDAHIDGINMWDVLRSGNENSPRTEFPYNIDPAGPTNSSGAIRVGDWKYYKGDKHIPRLIELISPTKKFKFVLDSSSTTYTYVNYIYQLRVDNPL